MTVVLLVAVAVTLLVLGACGVALFGLFRAVAEMQREHEAEERR